MFGIFTSNINHFLSRLLLSNLDNQTAVTKVYLGMQYSMTRIKHEFFFRTDQPCTPNGRSEEAYNTYEP